MADLGSNSSHVPPSVPVSPSAPVIPPGPVPGAKTAPAGAKPGEAKPTDPPAVKDEPRVSGKLQLLAQRERQALSREQAAKSKESQVQEATKALEAREARIKEFETLRETNPLKALELLGLSYQQLTEAALSDGNIPAEVQVKKLEAKVTDLAKAREEDARKAADEAKAQAERQEAQAVEEFRSEIKGFIEQNPKDYEFIQFEAQENLVFRVINEHYVRTTDPETGVGKIMTIKEAADKVEAFLEKRYEKLLSLEKIKSKLAPGQGKPPAKPQTIPSSKPTAPTLNNTMSPGHVAQPTGLLTDEQRVAKAIAYARGIRPQT